MRRLGACEHPGPEHDRDTGLPQVFSPNPIGRKVCQVAGIDLHQADIGGGTRTVGMHRVGPQAGFDAGDGRQFERAHPIAGSGIRPAICQYGTCTKQ